MSEGAYWIEEPIRHDDYRPLRRRRRSDADADPDRREFSSLPQLAAALWPSASDYLMLDVDRIGGVSGWRSAAGLAEATAARSRRTYTRKSAPIYWPRRQRPIGSNSSTGPDRFCSERLAPADGHVSPLPGPGIGLRWDEDAVSRFRVNH